MTKKEFEEKYMAQLTFDSPIYVEDIPLYPIQMEQYYEFNIASSILQIKKDRIPDARVISMSYMEYLIMLIEQESANGDQSTIGGLYASLIALCTRNNDIRVSIDKNEHEKYCFAIDGVKLTNRSFNEMKDIILFQNNPSYTGIELNEELEKEIEEADRIRNYGKHSVSLEEIIISAMVGTSANIEDIKKMSIRKFFKLISMKDKEMNYKILTQASMSGFVTFKSPIQHYLETTDSNWLDDKVHTYNSFKNKLGSYAKS